MQANNISRDIMVGNKAINWLNNYKKVTINPLYSWSLLAKDEQLFIYFLNVKFIFC